jgi:hypothetical protein
MAILSRIVFFKDVGSPFKVQWIVSRSPTVTSRINNAVSWQLLLLALCGVDADPYKRYAELITLHPIIDAQSWRLSYSTSKEFCWQKFQKAIPYTNDIGSLLLSYLRSAESATTRINDMRSWKLPASLIVGSRFLISLAPVNSNSNPKRLQQLGPV